MSTEAELQAVLASLKSRLKKDQESGLEAISILAKQERFVNYLSSDDSEKGINWNTLFLCVHQTIFTQADKKGETTTKKSKELMTSTLDSVVSHSRGRIRASSFISAIVEVFGSATAKLCVGNFYLDILNNNVLQSNIHLAEVKCEGWSDLITLLSNLLTDGGPGSAISLYLEILAKIVENGSQHALSPRYLKQLVPFLERHLLIEREPSNRHDSAILHLVNVTLLALAADYRFTVVDFVETTTSKVVRMYEPGRDKNQHIFEFLDLAINVHHPEGAAPDDTVAYACNWNVWKTLISEIFHVCEKEVVEVLRAGENSQVLPHFLNVLVDVANWHWQFRPINDDSPVWEDRPASPMTNTFGKRKSVDHMWSQTQKRARSASLESGIIYVLNNMPQTDAWFWLQFTHSLLVKYPNSVKKDVGTITERMCHMLCEVRNPDTINLLGRCAEELLNLQQASGDLSQTTSATFAASWDKVVETSLRNIVKNNADEYHCILQALIQHSKIKDPDIFLESCFKNDIVACNSSIETMTSILLTSTIEEHKKCKILEWGLESMSSPLPTVNLVLAALVREVIISNSILEKKGTKKYCDIYNDVAFKRCESTKVIKRKYEGVAITVSCKLASVLLNRLKARCNQLMAILKGADLSWEDFSQAAVFVEVVLRILSATWDRSDIMKKELSHIAQNIFNYFAKSVNVLLNSQRMRLEILSHTLTLDVRPEVHTLIRDPLNSNELEYVTNLFETFKEMRHEPIFTLNKKVHQESQCHCEYVSDFGKLLNRLQLSTKSILKRESLGRKTGLRVFLLDTTDVLCSFMKSDDELTHHQEIIAVKTVKNLLEDTHLSPNSPLHMQMALTVIYTIATIKHCPLLAMNDSLELLKRICGSLYTNRDVNIVGMSILQEIAPTLKSRGDETSRKLFSELMEGFYIIMGKKTKFGILRLVEPFVRLIGEVFKADSNIDICLWNKQEEMTSVLMNLLCNESTVVRLSVANTIGNLFVQFGQVQDWQREALRSLASNLLELGDGDLYCRETLSATSLLALGHVLASVVNLRIDVAYLCIQFIYTQDCSVELVRNFLKLLSNQLEVSNASQYFSLHLSHFVAKWLKDGRRLEVFPYQILNLPTRREFYLKHVTVIVSQAYINEKEDLINDIATTLNMSTSSIMKDAFPAIMASLVRDKDDGKLKQLLRMTFNIQYVPPLLHFLLRETKSKGDFFSALETFKGYFSDSDSPILLELATDYSFSIQRCLLLLETDLVDAVTTEDRTECFRKYMWFVECYIDSKGITSATQVDCYVLRDAVSVALRVIRLGERVSLVQQICAFLKTVLTSFLKDFSADVSALLPGIVSALLPAATSSESAKALLKFLVIDNRQQLWSAIQRLDTFPTGSGLNELNAELITCRESFGLLQELKLFSNFVGPSCRRIGGLARLLSVLSDEKVELLDLLKGAQVRRGFSEDSNERVLHLVIYQLMTLCSHDDDVIRAGAAKCLGELGPVDLATLVLKSTSNGVDPEQNPAEVRLTDTIVPLLGQLVQQEALVVKRAACDALYAAFRCNALPSHSSAFLVPFQTHAIEEYQMKIVSDTGPLLSIWMPTNDVAHESWVVGVVTGLLDVLSASHDLCSCLSAVCQAHATFSENIFGNIMDCIVTLGSRALLANISHNISAVLNKYIEDPSSVHLKSIRCIVSALDCVRYWSFREQKLKLNLDVNYLLIAQVAKDCELHFISLMFAELWFEQQKKLKLMNDKSKLRVQIDEIGERSATLSNTLRENYASIGIIDGLEGCGSSHLVDPALRVAYLEHSGRWDISLLTHDVTRNLAGVARSLNYFGLFETLSHLTTDVSTKLDCATRLGDWSIVLPDCAPSYEIHRYRALRAYHHLDYASFVSEAHEATNIVLTEIAENKMESMRKIYQQMSQLQCVKDHLDFASAVVDGEMSKLRDKWNVQDMLPHSEFSLKESILTSRSLIVNEELKRKDSSNLKDLLCEQYLKLCKLSRNENKFEVGIRNALLLSKVSGASVEMKMSGRVEEARSLWGKGEQKLGMLLLAGVVKDLECSRNSTLLSKCLRMYGDWMVETKAENPLKIINDYFIKSFSLTNDPNDKLDSYASIAKFADSNYVQLNEYLESSQFLSKSEILNLQNSLMFGLKKELIANRNDHDKQLAFNMAVKQSAIDEDEIRSLNGESINFLKLAIRYYLLSLQSGDKYDDLVFRLVSLWMKNGTREDVKKILEELLSKVPSHKFICLLPQMAPRMGEVNLISDTVERTLKEHPHHVLPVLFALSNSHADFPYFKNPRDIPAPSKRILAARELLRSALLNPHLTKHVHQMKQLTDAFLEFANREIEVPRSVLGPFKLPSEFLLPKIENLHSALVPSLSVPPNPNLRYDNIIGVQKFENQFEMVGGINAPKKLICIGTDGVRRPLLLKGKDDPRQDAVMQQVFGIINGLLARDVDTARRKLVMRTYRVQPLSQRSGVIEWCEDTQTLGWYLIGKAGRGGAHARHHPEDLSAAQCRQIYTAVAKADVETKMTTYLDICSKFKPALHYFFLENFPTACSWFERRLAYTRSVATSSMIGYILGIGDRHLMNILIDNKTAEAIHIDLGIAFEQGRNLPTPETVPFRLTRDIEDGMGCSGVDGVYRMCCEKTMKVMRENKDTILTLLEVLLYDPLYCWSISPEKAMSMQNRCTNSSSQELDSDDNINRNGVNTMAERALTRLKEKLQGMEQGGVVSTVEGQVGGLIQKARDPANLCRLFQGWQPYL